MCSICDHVSDISPSFLSSASLSTYSNGHVIMSASKNDRFSEQETARRRDAVIKRMLATPPKPHSEMKVGKPRGKPAKSPAVQSNKRRKRLDK